ncbi:unnamed protein product, partial [Pylaiella littoralis]
LTTQSGGASERELGNNQERNDTSVQLAFAVITPRSTRENLITFGATASNVHVSRRPASKWEREKASQLSRSAASAHQHIITSFVKGSGGPIERTRNDG